MIVFATEMKLCTLIEEHCMFEFKSIDYFNHHVDSMYVKNWNIELFLRIITIHMDILDIDLFLLFRGKYT